MFSHVVRCVVTAIIAVLSLSGYARAEADGPDYFRVVDVAPDDVLNIRADAGADHAKIGEIPPDADGVRNLGCVGGLSFAEWAQSSEEERAAAERTRWCRVDYAGTEGWVAARYLAEGSAPDASGGSVWQIVSIDGAAAAPEAELAFGPDGSFSGTVGCNRFFGQAAVEDGRLAAAGPVAATKMACVDGAIARQEAAIFDLLGTSSRIAYDPVADQLKLLGAGGLPAAVLERKAP